MSDFEVRDGSGSLFRNERKEPDSKQPDYTGNGRINGAMVDISAWLKTSRGGKKYLSLSFKPPFERKTKPARAERHPATDDQDLPF